MDGQVPSPSSEEHRRLERSSILWIVFIVGVVRWGEGPQSPARHPQPHPGYANLPLTFEPNLGQMDARAKFVARDASVDAYFTDEGVRFALRQSVALSALPFFDMRLVGASRSATIAGEEVEAGQSHYFKGSDPSQWTLHVPQFRKVRYSQIYPAIDLVSYGNRGQLEYDFVLRPGSAPQAIELAFEGVDFLGIDERGDLVIEVEGRKLIQRPPIAYQDRDGDRARVSAEYVLASNNTVRFKVGAYDVRRPLIIDPILTYASYLGGSGADSITGVALDGGGNLYVTGSTVSTDFPTQAPIQGSAGGFDAFVTKIDPNGSSILFSTYLGGSDNDFAQAIAVDSSGSAYIAGPTLSLDFPTFNAYQLQSNGDFDCFVAKLDPTGSALIYSTYLGGSQSDDATGIAVDASGSAYVAGYTNSTDFPVFNAAQPVPGGNYDAFLTKLDPSGGSLSYSTFLGGAASDYADALAVDLNGNAAIVGSTASMNFPTLQPIQGDYGGGDFDGFIAIVSSTGSTLLFSTYFGGSGIDHVHGVSIDKTGNFYVVGSTTSANFITTTGAFQPVLRGGSDAFVAELNPPSGTVVYSTYLGGNANDSGSAIAVDGDGNAYLIGSTASSDFPMVDPIQANAGGQDDAFVAKLNPQGTALLYSTYFGGPGEEGGNAIALTATHDAYAVGSTSSTTNLATPGALQGSYGGGVVDGFIAKITEPSD